MTAFEPQDTKKTADTSLHLRVCVIWYMYRDLWWSGNENFMLTNARRDYA